MASNSTSASNERDAHLFCNKSDSAHSARTRTSLWQAFGHNVPYGAQWRCLWYSVVLPWLRSVLSALYHVVPLSNSAKQPCSALQELSLGCSLLHLRSSQCTQHREHMNFLRLEKQKLHPQVRKGMQVIETKAPRVLRNCMAQVQPAQCRNTPQHIAHVAEVEELLATVLTRPCKQDPVLVDPAVAMSPCLPQSSRRVSQQLVMKTHSSHPQEALRRLKPRHKTEALRAREAPVCPSAQAPQAVDQSLTLKLADRNLTVD